MDSHPLFRRFARFARTVVVAVSTVSLSGCAGGGDGAGVVGGGGPPLPTCIATANHGCVSKEEFDRLREAAATAILADSEFRSPPPTRTFSPSGGWTG